MNVLKPIGDAYNAAANWLNNNGPHGPAVFLSIKIGVFWIASTILTSWLQQPGLSNPLTLVLTYANTWVEAQYEINLANSQKKGSS